MGARPYDSSLGRFVTVDPVDGGSANAYDYVAQDPVNSTDLDGRCLEPYETHYNGIASGVRWRENGKRPRGTSCPPPKLPNSRAPSKACAAYAVGVLTGKVRPNPYIGAACTIYGALNAFLGG